MTTEHHDLWAERHEWERDHDPGLVLDWWREAYDALEPLAKLVEYSPNEALSCTVYDAQNRVRSEIARWEEEVRMRLEWNKAHGKLTPFGRVLKLLMERAGYQSARELLYAAGRLGESHAVEVLERRMYGPDTRDRRRLDGVDEALGISDKERTWLAVTAYTLAGDELAEKAAKEAEAELWEGARP
jgi:hypothetical protein